MPDQTTIVNPHLNGQPFFWQGGEVGVLLSHGFGASPAEIRPVAERLHQHGLTVSGLLLPGHMTSIRDINKCRWQDWADAYQDAYTVLAKECLEVFVGGESMGALLALYQASLVNNHPVKPDLAPVRGVINFAPVIKHRSKLAPFLSNCLALVKESIEKPESISSPALPNWQGYSVYPIPAAHQLFLLQSVVRRRLKYIQVPILAILGENDRTVDPTSLTILERAAKATSVETHWLTETGHCIALEDRKEQVVKITLNFISKYSRLHV